MTQRRPENPPLGTAPVANRDERGTHLDRHQTDPLPARSRTDAVSGGPGRRLPRLAVATWAAGSDTAPSGRRVKKMRRRARKVAAALAAILVLGCLGGTAAMADPAFYRASPYVNNAELVDAGSKTYEPRLAIGEPENIGGNALAASTLEDAILTGGLSPDDMEMPDMMLAGISGDQMTLAAASDGDAALDGTEQQQPAAGDPAQTEVDASDGTVGKGPPTDESVEDLAEDAGEENPNGYASPALNGDPEPIVEEYAAASTLEEALTPAEPEPVASELASASTGGSSDAVPVSGSEPTGATPTSETDEEPVPTQSDELAYTPVSGEAGSEESGEYAPEDPGGGEEAATNPSPPAELEDDSGTELVPAGERLSDDAFARAPDESDAAGPSETLSKIAPPKQVAPDEAADPPYPHAFEEEADDYAQGTPPDHSAASENAAGALGEAQEEGSEPGPQYQAAVVAFGDEEASEDTPPEIAPEGPPGWELEQGRGHGGDGAPSEQAEADARQGPSAGDDQTFSDPEGTTVEDRPTTGEQAQGAWPQAQEGQDLEGETPLHHGQVGESEPAPALEDAGNDNEEVGAWQRPEQEAQGEPGAQNFAEPEAPSSERGPDRALDRGRRAATAPARDEVLSEPAEPAGRAEGLPAPQTNDSDGSVTSDELRASPKDGVGRTLPVWDRQGLTENDRPQNRSPERHAAAQQLVPAPAERASENRRAERRAELRVERQQEQRTGRQVERRAKLQAQRRAARKAELQAIREDRQADLRAARHAERIETREVAASAAEPQGFADPAAPGDLARGGAHRWDAPAVEPSLPEPKAQRWARRQPAEPVIAEPAYRNPAPVRAAGAGASNNPAGKPVGNTAGGDATNPTSVGGGGAAGALKEVMR